MARNIAAHHPEIVERLEGRLDGWAAELRPPGLSSDNSGFIRYSEGWFAEPQAIAK